MSWSVIGLSVLVRAWPRSCRDYCGVSALGIAKPLVNEATDQDPHPPPRDFHALLPRRAAVVVQTLTCVASVVRRHRKTIGSCWRKLSPGRQALLVLAYLRKDETFADLAAGFAIGWRYVTETVALLAARSPKLRRALTQVRRPGRPTWSSTEP